MTLVPLESASTGIDGLVRLRAKAIHDDRGIVRELFRGSAFADVGLPQPLWRQINLTETRRGAIRGLHGEQMSKLVGVVVGEALGVYVDVRPESPTRGAVETVQLKVGVQVMVPPGVCNGFQALAAEVTQYLYAFDAEWAPDMTGTHVNPLDPALGVDWPIPIDPNDRSLLSAKDAGLPLLADALTAVSGVASR